MAEVEAYLAERAKAERRDYGVRNTSVSTGQREDTGKEEATYLLDGGAKGGGLHGWRGGWMGRKESLLALRPR